MHDLCDELGLQCQVSPQQGIDWEFGVNPAELRNNFTFSLLGHLDAIVPRPELKGYVARLLRLFTANGQRG